MSDPLMLQYLQDIKDGVTRIENKVETQDTRISSLEETRTTQRGIMIGGGTVVTFFAGCVAWLVDHWGK